MMTRGKRALCSSNDGEDNQQDFQKQKRPALARIIVEALKVDGLQKLCSSLEPHLRLIVTEEVESALLRKFGPRMVCGSFPVELNMVTRGNRALDSSNDGEDNQPDFMMQKPSPKQIQGPDGRNLALRFQPTLPREFFTGIKVEGAGGAPIRVVLIDMSTGDVVRSGPESCVRLDVVVLEGDCNNDEEDNEWTEEDFESHVVKPREGKSPLLTGNLKVSLKDGVQYLEQLTFTDNSSWTRSKTFRLGVKPASDFRKGIRVRGAKTNAFRVKEQRGEVYKKHYPPSLNDEVWRLDEIGKGGSYQTRLNDCEIYTVDDFLNLRARDPQRLRKILGGKGGRIPDKTWHKIVDHAETCVRNKNREQYYSAESSEAKARAESQKVFAEYDNTTSSFQTSQQVLVYPPSLVPSGQVSLNSGLVIRDDLFPIEQQVFGPQQPSPVPLEPVNSEPAVGDDPIYYVQQVFGPHQPSPVPLEPANSMLGVGDDPFSFEQLSPLFPSGQTLLNSGSNVGGGTSPDKDSWWENLIEEPPREDVVLRLMLLSVLRFMCPVDRKGAQLV